MQRVKLTRSVLLPIIGYVGEGQELSCKTERAVHLVETIKCAEYISSPEGTTEPVKDIEHIIYATSEQIIEAINALDTSNELYLTVDGKPKVEMLEDLLDKKVTAQQRDEALAQMQG